MFIPIEVWCFNSIQLEMIMNILIVIGCNEQCHISKLQGDDAKKIVKGYNKLASVLMEFEVQK